MKPIIDTLIDHGLSLVNGQRLEDIRAGLGYTAVKLDTQRAGVACMLRHRLGKSTCSLLPDAGSLSGMAADRALHLLRSSNPVEASIGLAALNALVDEGEAGESSNDDLVEMLGITPKDRVGMVGDIMPLLWMIRDDAGNCVVFDEGKNEEKGITSTDMEGEELPGCSVVLLSATTLLNGTFDDVLSMASGAREICVIGPSAPLLPDIFRDRGVTMLSGRRFTDVDRLLRIVSEAGGTRCFGPVSVKVNIRLKE
jgi:uncharacterized protein (DUF4213/DUF364 family)